MQLDIRDGGKKCISRRERSKKSFAFSLSLSTRPTSLTRIFALGNGCKFLRKLVNKVEKKKLGELFKDES
jgi:hypothetical protein